MPTGLPPVGTLAEVLADVPAEVLADSIRFTGCAQYNPPRFRGGLSRCSACITRRSAQ